MKSAAPIPLARGGALAWGRLVRLSLFPSAAADAIAGAVLGAGTWPLGAGPLLLILGSLAVYHGALALNDWADREVDARARPERPLPSGAIRPGAALGVALALLAAGVALGIGAGRAVGAPHVGWMLAAVAALAALYDVAGRGALSGPLLLGLCRAGNLGAGIALGAAAVGGDALALWPFPALYGAYVFAVSRLGRMEDAEDARPLGRRPSALLAVGAALLVAPVWVPLEAQPGALAAGAAVLVSGLGALGLARLALRREPWTRGDVMRSMGASLRRLLVFTAACALVGGSRIAPDASGALDGWIAAAVILAGYPASYALRRAFPPS